MDQKRFAAGFADRGFFRKRAVAIDEQVLESREKVLARKRKTVALIKSELLRGHAVKPLGL